MSNEDKAQKQGAPAQAKKKNVEPKSNIVAINFNNCLLNECSSKPKTANFCDEHYEWFKFGLLTKEGNKPKDFDKKMQDFQRFQERKAA